MSPTSQKQRTKNFEIVDVIGNKMAAFDQQHVFIFMYQFWKSCKYSSGHHLSDNLSHQLLPATGLMVHNCANKKVTSSANNIVMAKQAIGTLALAEIKAHANTTLNLSTRA